MFFAPKPTIVISFNGEKNRNSKLVRAHGQNPQEHVIFAGQEPVSGTVEVIVPPGKKIDHLGVKIELIGVIG